MIACRVRLPVRKSSLANSSTKLHASVAACCMWWRSSGSRFSLIPVVPPRPPWPGTSAAGRRASANRRQRRGAGQCIDRQIEVAAILIGAMQHRSEDARVCRAEAACRFTHRASLHIKRNRRSHEHPFLSRLIAMAGDREWHFKHCFRHSLWLDSACCAGRYCRPKARHQRYCGGCGMQGGKQAGEQYDYRDASSSFFESCSLAHLYRGQADAPAGATPDGVLCPSAWGICHPQMGEEPHCWRLAPAVGRRRGMVRHLPSTTIRILSRICARRVNSWREYCFQAMRWLLRSARRPAGAPGSGARRLADGRRGRARQPVIGGWSSTQSKAFYNGEQKWHSSMRARPPSLMAPAVAT